MIIYLILLIQDNPTGRSASIGFLYAWVFVWQATVGPAFTAVVTEIFPVAVRSVGISFVFSILFLVGFLTLLFYSTFRQVISTPVWSGFFILSNLVVLVPLFNPSVFPETNGISLYQADIIWQEAASTNAPGTDSENAEYSKLDGEAQDTQASSQPASDEVPEEATAAEGTSSAGVAVEVGGGGPE